MHRPGAPPPAIIDADDLLEDPLGVMEAFSKAVRLPAITPNLLLVPLPVASPYPLCVPTTLSTPDYRLPTTYYPLLPTIYYALRTT